MHRSMDQVFQKIKVNCDPLASTRENKLKSKIEGTLAFPYVLSLIGFLKNAGKT